MTESIAIKPCKKCGSTPPFVVALGDTTIRCRCDKCPKYKIYFQSRSVGYYDVEYGLKLINSDLNLNKEEKENARQQILNEVLEAIKKWNEENE